MHPNYWKKILLFSIFFLSFVSLIVASRANSITTDEGVHLFAGVTYLKERDFRLDPEHPPLLKELGALPLVLFGNLQYQLDANWQKASEFDYDSWKEARLLGYKFQNQNSENIIFWARLPFVFLTLLLGFIVYIWSRKLYSEKIALFAVFFTLLFPNILAHGHLVNTDLGLTLFFFTAIYFWGSFLKLKDKKYLFLTALFTGFILASKFTGFIVIPVLFVLSIANLIYNKIKMRIWLRESVVSYLVLALISIVIIFVSYGFSFEQSAYYIKGLQMVFNHAVGGHDSFLLGEIGSQGWWYYFLVLILFKTPIVLLLLFLSSIFYLIKLKKISFDDCWILIPLVIYLIVAMSSNANLGVRHILPIFPFFILFALKGLEVLEKSKIVVVAIILWYLVSFAISFPNFLSYFNEFAGGPYGGHKIALDSNLDWGQNTYRLKKFMQDKNYYLVYNWNGSDYLLKNGIYFKTLGYQEKNIHGQIILTSSELVSNYGWLDKFPKKQIFPGIFLVNVN